MATCTYDGDTAPRTLSLGFSPCPNDTFIFHALVHGLVPCGLRFQERLEDVETLNRLALSGALEVSKVSYHLLGHILDDYLLLRSGGALGRGCGPLLVARAGTGCDARERTGSDAASPGTADTAGKGAGSEAASPRSPAEAAGAVKSGLRGKRIALPGAHTTAALLLRLFDPTLTELVYLPFERIMPAVADGSVDAGVIIHESRFTYAAHGLVQLVDLGQWWEEETGHPIPLGGIAAKRSLGDETLRALECGLEQSVAYGFGHPGAARAYIRAHSQEMSDAVCDAHIGLYVNDFSRSLGAEGEAAVRLLLERATGAGIIAPWSGSLFIG